MATTVRASSKNSNTTGTAISVAAPTGTAAGDVVIVAVHANGQTTIVDNNGGTPFTEDVNDYKPNTTNGHTASIFSRRMQVGDPTTYAFTSGASGRWGVIAVTFQSPHATDIYDATPVTGSNSDTGASTTITVASITTATANAIHCSIGWADDGNVVFTAIPTGYTEAQRILAAAGAEQMVFTHKVITAAGATGTTAFTMSAGHAWFGISLAIKDVGGAATRIKDPLGLGYVPKKR